MRNLFSALVILMLAAQPAFGEYDLDKARSRMEKYTERNVSDNLSKALCVCDDGSANDDRAGVIQGIPVSSGGITRFQVTCYVMGFSDTTGEVVSLNSCDPWIPLTR